MSKYDALWQWVAQQPDSDFTVSLEELGRIAGVPIDHSLLRFKKELEAYGFRVAKISLKQQTVRFCRI